MWRSWVAGLSSVVADEETRIARMEMDGQLESIAISPSRKDQERTQGDARPNDRFV